MRLGTLSGPVVGVRPPSGAPRRDLAVDGYVCEEFLLEGTAVAYQHLGEGRPDAAGRWAVDEIGEGAYRTRILVVRPTEADGFNGTVLLHWMNVSAGREIERPEDDELYRGYAWVGVSVQEVGLYGAPWGAGGGGRRAPALGLIDADPERYSTLFHPGEAGSFSIFTQAARAVGPGRNPPNGAVDPLGGLDVQRVIATGGSQSAMRLASYINGIHPTDRAVDGFLLTVWEGRMPLIDEGPVALGMRSMLRNDLDVPVMIVNSEFEASQGAAVDMPDSNRLRVWEVTGTGHGHWRKPKLPVSSRGWSPNPVSWKPVERAAIRAMHRWVSGGEPAPSQLRIAKESDGSILRDSLGIAQAGVRLPEISVPIGEYRGASFRTGFGALYGGFRPFTPHEIGALYPSRDIYRHAWELAVTQLIEAETMLAEDAQDARGRGRAIAESLPID